MFTNKASVLLLSSAILALPIAALSQTTSGSTSTTTATSTSSTTTNKEGQRLVTQYTKLAGSEKNATSLVDGLRSGTQVTLTSSDGKTTTFTPPTGKMGYGEVNTSLALAEKMMSTNSNLTLSGALNGSGSTQGILQMRASGMGWGKIANSLGFKLGDVMRSAKADSASQRSERSQRAERSEKAERPEKVERPEKIERPEKVERPQRPDRPERAGR